MKYRLDLTFLHAWCHGSTPAFSGVYISSASYFSLIITIRTCTQTLIYKVIESSAGLGNMSAQEKIHSGVFYKRVETKRRVFCWNPTSFTKDSLLIVPTNQTAAKGLDTSLSLLHKFTVSIIMYPFNNNYAIMSCIV